MSPIKSIFYLIQNNGNSEADFKDKNTNVKFVNDNEENNNTVIIGCVESKRNFPPIPSTYIHSLGLLFALLNAFAESTSSAMVKVSQTPTSMLILIRTCSQAVTMLVIILCTKVSVSHLHKDKHLLLIRTLLGLSMLPMMFSVKYIPLSQASVIMFTSPVFTQVFAHFCLNEPFGRFEALLLVPTVVGIVAIADPNTIMQTQEHLLGCSLALLKSLIISVAAVVIRRLKHVHWSVMMFLPCIPSGLASLALVFILNHTDVPSTTTEIIICVAISLTGILKQLFLTVALQMTTAGAVSLTACTSVIFSLLYQYYLFHEPVSPTSWGGVVLISVSVLGLKIRVYYFNTHAYNYNPSSVCELK